MALCILHVLINLFGVGIEINAHGVDVMRIPAVQ